MSRPLRIGNLGACYHVMNRGLTDQAVFVLQSDSGGLLALVVEGDKIMFSCWKVMATLVERVV